MPVKKRCSNGYHRDRKSQRCKRVVVCKDVSSKKSCTRRPSKCVWRRKSQTLKTSRRASCAKRPSFRQQSRISYTFPQYSPQPQPPSQQPPSQPPPTQPPPSQQPPTQQPAQPTKEQEGIISRFFHSIFSSKDNPKHAEQPKRAEQPNVSAILNDTVTNLQFAPNGDQEASFLNAMEKFQAFYENFRTLQFDEQAALGAQYEHLLATAKHALDVSGTFANQPAWKEYYEYLLQYLLASHQLEATYNAGPAVSEELLQSQDELRHRLDDLRGRLGFASDLFADAFIKLQSVCFHSEEVRRHPEKRQQLGDLFQQFLQKPNRQTLGSIKRRCTLLIHTDKTKDSNQVVRANDALDNLQTLMDFYGYN